MRVGVVPFDVHYAVRAHPGRTAIDRARRGDLSGRLSGAACPLQAGRADLDRRFTAGDRHHLGTGQGRAVHHDSVADHRYTVHSILICSIR
jgi:hypothetical protein